MGSLNLVYGNFSYVCIMEYQKDVHTEHCCLGHGCKYRDPNCTVENGTKPQSWDCEQCDWEFSDENSEYRLMINRSNLDYVMAREKHNISEYLKKYPHIRIKSFDGDNRRKQVDITDKFIETNVKKPSTIIF